MTALVWVLVIFSSCALIAEAPERFVAIDNVCAWPNLTLLDDGSLFATIFNRPAHGIVEGDVECWMSGDAGRIWKLRGVPAPHEPGRNRHNVAAGTARDGSLVVIASGIDLASPRSSDGSYTEWKFLPLVVARSSDKGRTWQRTSSVTLPEGVDYLIPFGNIVAGPEGTLAAPFYLEHRYSKTASRGRPAGKRTGTAYLLTSKDDGRSWGDAVVIGAEDYNETVVLRLSAQRWLAAARTYSDGRLDLFVSTNEGRTWTLAGPLTLPRQHPGHLLRLADGRILLTYGVREHEHQGVGTRLSKDEGRTWGPATLLVHLAGTTDGGYPSTVQLADGTLVTAYYSNGIPEHRRYHMGVVRWTAPPAGN